MISWSAMLVFLPLVSALPAERGSGSGLLCDQFSTYSIGPYSLLTNLWGQSHATSGSQCSQVDSVDGNTVSWQTNYTWTGDNSVKSYTNIQLNDGINKQLSEISSMHTTWAWDQQDNGSNVVSDVAYDLFTSNAPGGSNLYEMMVWLYSCNAGPICYNYDENGKPIPIQSDLSIGAHTWNLYKGSNGDNEVFSFLPASGAINTFSGDIHAFLSYLISKNYISESEYLITAQAGTEATSGSATLKTSSYSLTIA